MVCSARCRYASSYEAMYCKGACAVVPIVSVLRVGHMCCCLVRLLVVGCLVMSCLVHCHAWLRSVFLDWSLLVVCPSLRFIDHVDHGGGLSCAWLFLFVLGCP